MMELLFNFISKIHSKKLKILNYMPYDYISNHWTGKEYGSLEISSNAFRGTNP